MSWSCLKFLLFFLAFDEKRRSVWVDSRNLQNWSERWSAGQRVNEVSASSWRWGRKLRCATKMTSLNTYLRWCYVSRCDHEDEQWYATSSRMRYFSTDTSKMERNWKRFEYEMLSKIKPQNILCLDVWKETTLQQNWKFVGLTLEYST